MSSYRQLAHNRDFTILWVGGTISELGSGISMFAFPLLTYAITGSVIKASVVLAVLDAGRLAVLLPAGLWADRRDRRRIIQVSSVLGAVAFAAVAVAGAVGILGYGLILAAALATGVAAGLAAPAESSAIRSVVSTEDLPTALSQNQARQHVASLVGPPLGGVLFGLLRWLPFLADAISYAAYALMAGRIRTDLSPAGAPSQERPLRQIVSGWRFLGADGFFRTLLIAAPFANLTINAIFIVAELRLIADGYPAWQIGLVSTAAGVSGVLGALCAPWIIDRVPSGLLMVIGMWMFVPLLVPMALWSTPLVVGAAVAVGLFVNPASNAGISSYAIAVLPADMVGRFSSTMNFTSMSTMPLAPIVGGVLLHLLGGAAATLGLAVLVALAALIPTLSRPVWRVGRPATWPRPTSPLPVES